MRSLTNSLKLENHTAQDIILYKWNKVYLLTVILQYYVKRTNTYTHMHTHKEFCGLKRDLRLTLFCYLVTLPEEDHSRDFAIFTAYRSIHQQQKDNRDLFGLLAFSWVVSWSGVSTYFLETSGCWLRDVTGETLLWLAVAWFLCDIMTLLGSLF